MTTKLVALFATLFINILLGLVVFFFMLLAMNGYSESDANYGLGAYIVLAVIVSLIMGTCATLLVHLLTKRNFRAWTSVLISVPIFSVLGGGLKIICSIIGIAVAEYVRVNY